MTPDAPGGSLSGHAPSRHLGAIAVAPVPLPSSEPRRFSLLSRLGIEPTVQTLVRFELDAALTAAEAAAEARGDAGGIAVLDAGCGRVSALRPFRSRIARFVGADIHPPSPGSLPYLDEFATVDLCAADPDAFEPASFDAILSSFTLEHFADPAAALGAFRHWLRPGGTLIATTVNRRHPLVAAYLAAPPAVRDRIQPWIKSSAADAHPIVGACNDPEAVEAALLAAGFGEVSVTTVSHLARAWGRTLPTFALGLLGDVLARRAPSRRSTIVAVARA
jgi:SAM-dependent methyltransferase